MPNVAAVGCGVLRCGADLPQQRKTQKQGLKARSPFFGGSNRKEGARKKKMYLYETHMHTSPLSACAKVSARKTLEFYKGAGYAGVFITDHFLDGNIDHSLRDLPYAEAIKRFFAALEESRLIGEELGLSVFPAFEMGYKGTDFLVYGIDEQWCLAHEDMHKMRKTELLSLLREDGALLIQAHPFREAAYIDHIRLYPRHVHGVEVFNANRSEFENELAAQYCKNYELIAFAGSDNHVGAAQARFGGIATDAPIGNVREFIELVLCGKARPFLKNENGISLL
jgi:predicted metal-dependent phosphoesterase TrpH